MPFGSRMTRPKALLTLAGATGLLLPDAAFAQTASPQMVRVGAGLDDGITPLLYAQQSGLFRAAGLDVQIQSSAQGGALASAVAGGGIDVAKSSLMALITGRARGIPFKIVAGAATFSATAPTTQLCVLNESPIRDVSQLTGKTVATSGLQSLDQVGIESLIDQAGANWTLTKFVELPFASMFPALEQGRADAAAITNPALADALSSGKVRTIGAPYAGIGKHLLIAAWFCTAEYAIRNRATVEAFGRVIDQSARYTNTHKAQTVPLLAAYSHLSPDVIGRMNRLVNATSIDLTEIQPAIDAAVKYKVIDKPFAASDFLLTTG